MNRITIDNVTYTFIGHAEDRMEQEEISVAQVEQTLLDPDRIEPSRSSGRIVYIRHFQDRKRPLVAVVDENSKRIITAYWFRL